jgi:hypothetical protein
MAKVLICETMLKPREVAVPSSKGDGTYWTVIPSTLFNDEVCDCPGFQFRGSCKHVKLIEEFKCSYYSTSPKIIKAAKEGDSCPVCAEKLILFETEPEYE